MTLAIELDELGPHSFGQDYVGGEHRWIHVFIDEKI
jgi:hypothetical protein